MFDDVTQVLKFDAHSQDANDWVWLGSAGSNRRHHIEASASSRE